MKNLDFMRVSKTIKGFKGARILVIGDLMLDKFIWGDVSRISPEAPVPVVHVKKESSMPGGAANVASNIKSLGGECLLVGVVGDDENARTLMKDLRQSKINTSGILKEKSHSTTIKTRVIAHHQHVVRIDRENLRVVSEHILKRLVTFINRQIKTIDAIIIEDYGKGLINPFLLKEVIAIARKHKKPILIDPKEEHLDDYKKISGATPNKLEAEIATRIKIKDNTSLQKAGRKLIKKFDSEFVLITLGEGGMELFEKGKPSIHIDTVAQDVFDVSGAGDTVIGTLALALSCGASKKEAAYIANCAAGIVVGKVGVALVKNKELLNKINTEINLN